jgi:hypothetical protein
MFGAQVIIDKLCFIYLFSLLLQHISVIRGHSHSHVYYV